MANKIRVCPECGRKWAENVIFCMACGERTVEKTGAMALDSVQPVVVTSKKEPVEKKIEPMIWKAKKEEIPVRTKAEVVRTEETPVQSKEKVIRYEEAPVKTTKIEDVKPVKEEKIPEIEDLILAYIRKEIRECGRDSGFIESIRNLIK